MEIMTDNTSNNRPGRRAKTRRRRPLFLLLLAGAGVALLILFFFRKEVPSPLSELQTQVIETVEERLAKLTGTTYEMPANQTKQERKKDRGGQLSLPSSPSAATEGLPPENNLEISEKIDPGTEAEERLNTFYRDLDNRPYMKSFALQEPSKQHFSRLIQKLLDNPPVVVRETDDLYTLLKNTAHFFRVLGKKNVLMLKGILDREKDSLEDILRSFYLLTEEPKRLQGEFAIRLDESALYDYAGFFLNTMGGRLYLFRRDSSSRMAVTYYAIRILDRANEAKNSPHGIDIRPALSALIDEMENGGNSLHYRDTYLKELYILQEKYQR